MDKRVTGTLLGIGGVLLWYMPWTQFSMGGMEMHTTGVHVGGIAYVLFMSSLAYAVLAWVPQPEPRIITAGLSFLLGVNFWIEVGEFVGWGLMGLCIVSGISLNEAIKDYRTVKRTAQLKASTGP